jgi:hypothetical protein
VVHWKKNYKENSQWSKCCIIHVSIIPHLTCAFFLRPCNRGLRPLRTLFDCLSLLLRGSFNDSYTQPYSWMNAYRFTYCSIKTFASRKKKNEKPLQRCFSFSLERFEVPPPIPCAYGYFQTEPHECWHKSVHHNDLWTIEFSHDIYRILIFRHQIMIFQII